VRRTTTRGAAVAGGRRETGSVAARRVVVGLLAMVLAGCRQTSSDFSAEQARVHIEMLAGTIGSRPIGTFENARARDYVAGRLRDYGFEVRIQEVDAVRLEAGRTARVHNVVAIRRCDTAGAIGLVSHYDSAPETPGAADAALGVAVALDVARVLGPPRPCRRTLMILLTDGEEAGLMGAVGALTDARVADGLEAVINIDAIGSSGTAWLFEAGAGAGSLIRSWAQAAPHPRGTSYATEIYRRLPNGTDFSVFRDRGIPGVNFAPIGDSYAYHTPLDTPARLDIETVRRTGENVLSTILAWQTAVAGGGEDRTFFDLAGTIVLSWPARIDRLLVIVALLTGATAWLKITVAACRRIGVGAVVLSTLRAAAAIAVAATAMIGVTWALRQVREVYHPWYAQPGWLLVLLAATGWLVVCVLGPRSSTGAAGAGRAQPPTATWIVALPLWGVMAAATATMAPGASFLWTLPLLAASAGLLVARGGSYRSAVALSVVVLIVAGPLWIPMTVEVFFFSVAAFGRMFVITPVFVYAAQILVAAIVLGPPTAALVHWGAIRVRPPIAVVTLAAVVIVAALGAYLAPAYTTDRPLRRHLRVLTEAGAATATWEVASTEPGLALAPGAPPGWLLATDAPRATIVWGRLELPFVYRTIGATPRPPPASISVFSVAPTPTGTELILTVVPSEAGLWIEFTLPEGLVPTDTTLAGVIRDQRWQAAYVAPPRDGLTWRARFAGDAGGRLRELKTVVTSLQPSGPGWPHLPDWLPQQTTAWTAAASWILAVP
jgi:hypothetical protein